MNKNTILEKQTGLGQKEIMSLIKEGGGGYRVCMLVNDLNVFFWQGDEEVGKFLCDLLRDPELDIASRYAAYAGLASFPNPSKEILSVLEEFRVKPENKTLVEAGGTIIQTVRDLLVRVL